MFTAGCVLLYFIWLSFRRQDKTGGGLFKIGLFRFYWRDTFVWAGMTVLGLVLVGCISWTATVHAAAFARATESKCLAVQEVEEKYVFTVGESCGEVGLLWNRVEIKKDESQPVKDFLEQE